jgi:long-chain fatty acid transport protein
VFKNEVKPWNNVWPVLCGLHVFLLSLFLSMLPGLSVAGGPVHGAKAAGMGTAFVAVADDPSAILFNAAGLTASKGTQIYGGNAAVMISSSYHSPTGASEDTDFQVFLPPHFYLSSDFGYENVVFGVGVHAPFGIGGRKWPETGFTRFKSTRAEIGTIAINPTIAFRLLPSLSIGLGVDYMRTFARAEKMLDQSAFGFGDGKLRLVGDGGDLGYNFGALLRLERFSLGFAYRSDIEVDVHGTATIESIAPALQGAFGGPEFETNTKSTLTFPEIWSIGLAYRPTEELTLALDYELVRWSSTNQTDLDLETEVPSAGITDATTVLNWKDSHQIKAGAEYRVNEKLSVRGGYAYISTFVPEHTIDPGNPDSNQHNFSAGFGYASGKLVIDAFYMIDLFEDRKVNNAILSGDYDNYIHFTGLSAGYKF